MPHARNSKDPRIRALAAAEDYNISVKEIKSMYKRPRVHGAYSTASARGGTKRKRPFVAGRDRTSGFYGRYGTRALGSLTEQKFFDTDILFTFSQPGSTENQLNLVPQGTTENTRIGRKMIVHSIQIKGVIELAAGAAGFDQANLALVQDTQANGAAAVITDVYDQADMTNNLINLANASRFKILKTWRIPMQAGGGVATAFSGNMKNLSYYKKCRIPIEFDSTTGAITEIKSNNLFFVAGGAQNDASTLKARVRIRYTD